MYDTYFKNADTEDKHSKQFHRIECWKRKDGIKSGTKLQASHEKEIPSPIVVVRRTLLLRMTLIASFSILWVKDVLSINMYGVSPEIR